MFPHASSLFLFHVFHRSIHCHEQCAGILRVSLSVEEAGLDGTKHGGQAYPEFMTQICPMLVEEATSTAGFKMGLKMGSNKSEMSKGTLSDEATPRVTRSGQEGAVPTLELVD